MTPVFEESNLSKAIARLGLPAMLGQLTTLIYNMADTFFVSLTQEPAMIAAVTLCVPILLIVMSIACVFGMGGGSVIARLLGEGRQEQAGRTMNFCTYAMVIAGAATAVLGLLFLTPLAELAGADAENLGYTRDYLRYIFLGAPFIMLSNGFVHLFRSAGLIRESTVGLILGNGVNIVLDYVFILPLGWGAAYGIAYKLDLVPIMLSVGLSQGITPLIGYCFGAGQRERMTCAMRLSILYGILLGGVFTLLFLLAGRPLAAVFLHEEDLIAQAGYFLNVLCLSAPTLGIINMVTSYFQALGKALHSLSITVMRNAVLFIPAVILLNRLWGLAGVIAAQPAVEALLSAICLVLYAFELRAAHRRSPSGAFRRAQPQP